MSFTTKDSGKRKQFVSGMQRDTNEGKPRFELITPLQLPYEESMLYRWASLMARGAAKYDDRNWEKAEGEEELNRFKESAFRHFMQAMCGETDEDHLAAVMFNLQGWAYVEWKLKNEK